MAKQGQCTDRARRSPRRDGDTPAGGLRTRPLVLPVLGLVIALLLLAPLSGAQPRSRAVPADGGRGPDLALPNGAGASSAGEPSAVAAPRYAGAPGIVSGRAYKHDATAPLRTLKPVAPSVSGPPRAEADGRDRTVWVNHTDRPDPVVQRSAAPLGATSALLAMPATATGWEGISESTSGCGCLPPDTNGDIGPNDYVQTVNAAFEVWSRTGAVRYGPANINTLWNGFGGVCASNNRGDPVLLYDAAADRWLISQFAFSVSIFGQPQGPYDECIAISTTGDPTGSWYRYGFQLSTADFPDYPHFGVWPDGYYMSVNWFTNASTYAGPRPYVFDRTAMLNGQAATFQTTSGPLGSAVAPLLPAHLTGRTPPPAGQPNVFAEFGSPLNLYTFQVNWATPASTAWTKSASLAVAGFTQLCASTRDCIPQPGTSQKLDGLGDRLMNRLAYRNLGDHDVLVVNHTVDAGGGQAGVRWYEIRNPATTPTIYQQGSYAPDTDSRWVGSAAMDAGGDIAVGYSVSSGTTFPSIRVTGRLAADSLNTLPQGETTLLTGTGYQADPSGLSDYNRWGDYSSMSVDPVDDCTFWYTSEYNNSKSYTWGTRIGSFKFAGCGAGPAPTSTPAPPTATTTPAPPTATSTPVPPAATATDTATATPAPITTATNTPIPATATATSTPLPTFTPTPTSTATAPRPPTPTNTPKPHKH